MVEQTERERGGRQAGGRGRTGQSNSRVPSVISSFLLLTNGRTSHSRWKWKVEAIIIRPSGVTESVPRTKLKTESVSACARARATEHSETSRPRVCVQCFCCKQDMLQGFRIRGRALSVLNFALPYGHVRATITERRCITSKALSPQLRKLETKLRKSLVWRLDYRVISFSARKKGDFVIKISSKFYIKILRRK